MRTEKLGGLWFDAYWGRHSVTIMEPNHVKVSDRIQFFEIDKKRRHLRRSVVVRAIHVGNYNEYRILIIMPVAKVTYKSAKLAQKDYAKL